MPTKIPDGKTLPSHLAASAPEPERLRQQAIGVKLRQMFDEVNNEPVPDEFLEILRKAEPPRAEPQPASITQDNAPILAGLGARLHEPNVLTPERFNLQRGVRLDEAQVRAVAMAICQVSTDILGPPRAGLYWMQAINLPALGDMTAEQLLATGRGPALIAYLNEMRFGSRG